MTWTGQPVPATVAYVGGGKVGDGKSKKVAVPQSTTITAGKFYLLDSFLGCAMQDVTTGVGVTAEVVLSLENAEYETDQINAAEAFAKGSMVYWDASNSRFTNTPTAIYAGRVTEAKDANNVIWFILSGNPEKDVDDELKEFLQNSVQTGLLAGAATTASTHADAGAYDFNVNITQGIVTVKGIIDEIAAAADFDVAHGAASPLTEAKPKINYTIVAKLDAGAITLLSVAGAAGAEFVAPSTAAITTAVTHADWIKIAQVFVERTGAAACTVTINNAARPSI